MGITNTVERGHGEDGGTRTGIARGGAWLWVGVRCGGGGGGPALPALQVRLQGGAPQVAQHRLHRTPKPVAPFQHCNPHHTHRPGSRCKHRNRSPASYIT